MTENEDKKVARNGKAYKAFIGFYAGLFLLAFVGLLVFSLTVNHSKPIKPDEERNKIAEEPALPAPTAEKPETLAITVSQTASEAEPGFREKPLENINLEELLFNANCAAFYQ